MKNAPLVLALLASTALPGLPTVPAAEATMSCRSKYVRFRDHHDLADARTAIHSRDGKVTLLLTERVVAFQLSDRTIRKVRSELRDKKEEQENWFAQAIVSTVAATVGELIDSSMECRIRDIRDVSYEDGRLVFVARDGRPLFENFEVDDSDVTESFSERDAHKFVKEFYRVKYTGR